MKDLPPIRSWTEEIDARCIAGVATSHVVRGGWVYGCAVFVIVDDDPRARSYYDRHRMARDRAVERLKRVVYDEHGGHLPAIGRLRDVGGSGIDLWW